jgi:thioredoxin-related protein
MKFIVVFLLFASTVASYSQKTFNQNPISVYNPKADSEKEIKKAVILADSLSKHVMLFIGGNWCPWCLKLNKFIFEDEVLDSLINKEFITVKINYSKENPNTELLQKLEFPQRFGFPVIVILDGKGARIHTQDTGLLESGDGYDRKKMISFFNNWKYHAFRPENYIKN